MIAVKVGPVNAEFKGKLQMTDVAPNGTGSTSRARAASPASAKARRSVKLSPDGEATRLKYDASAQVGGKIAQIGSRLVSSAAAKIADGFFKAFEAKMTSSAS